jgi:hypothetical protein
VSYRRTGRPPGRPTGIKASKPYHLTAWSRVRLRAGALKAFAGITREMRLGRLARANRVRRAKRAYTLDFASMPRL